MSNTQVFFGILSAAVATICMFVGAWTILNWILAGALARLRRGFAPRAIPEKR